MGEVHAIGDAFSSRSLPSPTPSMLTGLPLVSALLAFTIAQFLKMIVTWYKEKRWDSKRLLGSGGMPSSHSATVTALAAAVGFQEGTGGSSFALAVVLAAIRCCFSPVLKCSQVMYDASGIRLHAGKQAEVLNQIVCELPAQHPLSNVRPLHEPLGHTPLQMILSDES
ncbi:uncharacterized protein [Aristolochia californica]|uniref:uncharacterized protein isoform X3 n=1 Tax=Aristolochia californica TaxID=171875 RepID=UPI0035D8A834